MNYTYLNGALKNWLTEILIYWIVGIFATAIIAIFLWIMMLTDIDSNISYMLVWKWTWIVGSSLQSLESLRDIIGEAIDDYRLSRKWNIPIMEIYHSRTELGIFQGKKWTEIKTWSKKRYLAEVNEH